MNALRRWIGAAILGVVFTAMSPALAQTGPETGSITAPLSDEGKAWAALQRGAIVVFRHAIAPGGGDPPGMVIGDCSTQRNLDAAGRQQAKDIGERLRALRCQKLLYISPKDQ